MTRSEHLQFCKKCKNRSFNPDLGITCNLTNTIADFEGECKDFSFDSNSQFIPKVKAVIRPNEQRAKWAEYLIWAMLFMSIITLISNYLQYNMLLKLQEGINILYSKIEMNDIRVGIISLVYFVVYITSVVTFIRWFRRAYYNLHNRGNASYEEGWAAGAWFVPIISLFRPYRIMQELDDKMAALIEKHSSKKIKQSSVLIGLWWAWWVISNIYANITLRISWNAETLNETLKSTTFDMIYEVIHIPLAILAILVIRRVSGKEMKLAALEKESAIKLTQMEKRDS